MTHGSLVFYASFIAFHLEQSLTVFISFVMTWTFLNCPDQSCCRTSQSGRVRLLPRCQIQGKPFRQSCHKGTRVPPTSCLPGMHDATWAHYWGCYDGQLVKVGSAWSNLFPI